MNSSRKTGHDQNKLIIEGGGVANGGEEGIVRKKEPSRRVSLKRSHSEKDVCEKRMRAIRRKIKKKTRLAIREDPEKKGKLETERK